jgi:tripeptide aminopeptidase
VIRPVVIALAAAALAAGVTSAPAAAQCDARANRQCAEVRRLAGLPAVQRALQHIERTDDRTVRDLITLTQIPAPPFGEQQRGQAYAELLREAGADSVYTDEAGNVIAVRHGRGGGPTLAISGHLDTVFPEGTDVTVRQRGDTLFAPGVGDDTRGLVVVLAALRALEAAAVETRSDVLFIGTVGEEGLGDLRGVKHLFRPGGPRIDAFISVDGSGDTRIVNEALGSKRYRIAFEGTGGHSWGAFGIANPAHALGRAIRAFDQAAEAFTASGPRTSYNVGRIGGGTSVNAVPFEAWMEVDMRSESQSSLAVIDSLLKAAVQRGLDEENTARRRGNALTAKVELVGDRPSGSIDPATPLVQRALAVTSHLRLQPELQVSSTDSNVPIARGIPAITIGGGGVAEHAHSPEEWWANIDGARGIQRALLILLAQAGVADATS